MNQTVPTSKWVRELALAADCYGLVDFPPGFTSWPDDRKAEWSALAVCDLKHRATGGDKAAVDFFRLYRHWPEPPAPKPPQSKSGILRVGFVTPSLAMGGAEIWTTTMVADQLPGIKWSGVAVLDQNPEWHGGRKVQYQCPMLFGNSSVQLLAAVSDILIDWGITDFAQYLDHYRPTLIAFSQGACDWTRQMLASSAEWADYRAAVSEAATRPFDNTGAVEVLWNGIDPDRVNPIAGRAATRAAWGLSRSEKAVLYLGRFSHEKQPTAVCRACAALGRGYRPVLVGDGWKRAETVAEARKINPRVILPGPVDFPGDALAAADVFFLASPSEGFSLGMIEAWMASVPVACTQVGAVPEVEQRFGQLTTPITQPLEPRQMATAVKEALGRKGRQRARRAFRVAREHFTADAMRERWGKFLRRVGSEASGARSAK